MTDPAQPPSPPAQAPAPQAQIPSDWLGKFEAERQRAEAATKRLAEIEAKLAERAKGDEDVKATLAALNEKLQLTEREKAELAARRRDERIHSALSLAGVKHGAVDVEDLVTLVRGALTVDDQGRVVSAADPKIDADAFVKSYLDRKPHLAKPRTAQGSGASPFPAPAAPAPGNFDLKTSEGATGAFRAEIASLLGRNRKTTSTG